MESLAIPGLGRRYPHTGGSIHGNEGIHKPTIPAGTILNDRATSHYLIDNVLSNGDMISENSFAITIEWDYCDKDGPYSFAVKSDPNIPIQFDHSVQRPFRQFEAAPIFYSAPDENGLWRKTTR